MPPLERERAGKSSMSQNELSAAAPECAAVDNVPYTVVEPENALPKVSLEDLTETMREACARAGWTQLMPVQELALPYLMAGRDIMVQSRTGSGKTGAYLLPLLPRLHADEDQVQALVLVPTRELAVQVEREARQLFAESGLRVVAVYGGVGYGKQIDALRGGVQLVVGTPGRVLDHLLKRNFTLEHLRALIFDEADRMLSIGFYPDMKEVQRYLPRRHVHTALLSATYPPHVLKLAGEFQEDAALLSLSQQHTYVAEVQHLYCECRTMDKDRTLVRLIETENPASAIIFCNTKNNVHYITEVLKGFGYNAAELSADLSQARREEVLGKLREGKVQYLVATDVAARGIDIPDLSHVFLYEPPEDQESYIHRAGRTGRAGAAGTVISLVDVMQKMELERIGKYYKIPLIAVPNPTDDDVAAVVSRRLMAILEARSRKLTGLERMRVQRFTVLAQTLVTPSEDGEAPVELMGMLLDACYQEALRTPPEAPHGREESPRDGGRGEGRRKRGKGRRDDREGREDRADREGGRGNRAGRTGRAGGTEREFGEADEHSAGGEAGAERETGTGRESRAAGADREGREDRETRGERGGRSRRRRAEPAEAAGMTDAVSDAPDAPAAPMAEDAAEAQGAPRRRRRGGRRRRRSGGEGAENAPEQTFAPSADGFSGEDGD